MYVRLSNAPLLKSCLLGVRGQKFSVFMHGYELILFLCSGKFVVLKLIFVMSIHEDLLAFRHIITVAMNIQMEYTWCLICSEHDKY
jgi:hypothetical protein